MKLTKRDKTVDVLPARMKLALAPAAAAPIFKPATVAEETDDANKRRTPRRTTSIPGHMVFAGMRTPIVCRISDMSAGGARLMIVRDAGDAVTDPRSLPDELLLHIRVDRVEVACRIVWRSDDAIGVRFVSAPRPATRSLAGSI